MFNKKVVPHDRFLQKHNGFDGFRSNKKKFLVFFLVPHIFFLLGTPANNFFPWTLICFFLRHAEWATPKNDHPQKPCKGIGITFKSLT